MSEATPSGGSGAAPSPTLLLDPSLAFGGTPLARILREAGLFPVEYEKEEDVGDFLDALAQAPDLLVLPLGRPDSSGFEALRQVRRTERGRRIPVLGVVSVGDVDLDLRTLRAYGVVGVLDERQGPDAALDRIARLMAPLCNRKSERATCLFPVGVRVGDGPRTREFALNLSATGMRMTSRTALEPNTDVALRFRLPMISDVAIEADARVVHRSKQQNSWGRYEVGLFFYPFDAKQREIVEREVDRLLAG